MPFATLKLASPKVRKSEIVAADQGKQRCHGEASHVCGQTRWITSVTTPQTSKAVVKESLTVEEQALVEHGSRLAAGLRATGGFTANLQLFRR